MKKIALVLAAALTFAACGGGSSGPGSEELFDAGPSEGAGQTEQPAASDPADTEKDADGQEASGGGDLPDVEVVDIATGEKLALTSLVPAQRPLLVWFWAPH